MPVPTIDSGGRRKPRNQQTSLPTNPALRRGMRVPTASPSNQTATDDFMLGLFEDRSLRFGGVPGVPQLQPRTGGGGGGGDALTSSFGGGGAPSVPAAPAGPTVADVLRNIEFPLRFQLPPYLRDFGRFLEDALTSASSIALPVPKVEEGRLVTEGAQVQTQEIPQDVEQYAAMWQNFLDMLRAADFGMQQQLLQLRFQPDAGFFMSGDIPQLPNPREL